MTTDPRAIYRAELARRAAIGRPTPPADTVHRWLDVPGTHHPAPRSRAPERRKNLIPPRIAAGPDRTCGNGHCGEKARTITRGRCKLCDAYYRSYGVERHITPRYGASKL